MIARMLRATFAALALCCVITAGAETLTNPLIIGGQLQGSQATVSFKIPSGTANPATCTAGQLFFNSTTPALEYCSAANTWTAVGAGSGTVGAGTLGQCAGYASAGTTIAGVTISGDFTLNCASGVGAVTTIGGNPVPTMSALSLGNLRYDCDVTIGFGHTNICGAVITGLVLGNGTSAPSAFAGSTVSSGQIPTAISASGALTGTATPTLGASGTLGTIAFGNATSGTVKLQPTTGALGSAVITMPALTGPMAISSGTLTDGCATWSSGLITSSASPCGGGSGAFTNLSATGLFNLSGTENVTAGTTQTQAGATALSASVFQHHVNVNATSGNGVKFAAATLGDVHEICNDVASKNVQVYGTGTDTVNGATNTSGVTQGSASSGGFCVLYQYTSNGWQSLSPVKYSSSGNLIQGSVTSGGVSYSTPNVNPPNLTISGTNPTLASGGCSSAALTARNGTALFSVVVGTSCSGSQPLVITLPAANYAWHCTAQDTSNSAGHAPAQSSAVSTTSATITDYSRTTGLAQAWVDSDVVVISCIGG